jgi:hypothetical protein
MATTLPRNPCHPLFARDVFGAGFAGAVGDGCSAAGPGARRGATSGDARVSSMAKVIDAPAPAGVTSSWAIGGALWPATDDDDEGGGSVAR